MTSVFQSISSFFVCAVLAVFAQNAIFSRSLGVSRLIKIVDDTANTVLFGCLICMVQVIAAPLGYLANNLLAGLALRNALRPLVLVVNEAQRKLRGREVPASFRGLPINLIYIGILAMAIYGFTGHMVAI